MQYDLAQKRQQADRIQVTLLDNQQLLLSLLASSGASHHVDPRSLDGDTPVQVVANRGELARCLMGAGRRFSPERDAVAELIAERAEEG